jgi:prevent-host-death family protein
MKPVRYDDDADEELIDEIARYELRRPISDLPSQAERYVDQVRETDQPVVITQRGRAAALLVSYETFGGFLATRDEMSYPRLEPSGPEGAQGVPPRQARDPRCLRQATSPALNPRGFFC